MTTKAVGVRQIARNVTSDYTPDPREYFILVDTTQNPVTITLPSKGRNMAFGKKIVDAGGNSETNAITVQTEGSESIQPDGVSTMTLAKDHGEWEFTPEAVDWSFASPGPRHDRSIELLQQADDGSDRFVVRGADGSAKAEVYYDGTNTVVNPLSGDLVVNDGQAARDLRARTVSFQNALVVAAKDDQVNVLSDPDPDWGSLNVGARPAGTGAEVDMVATLGDAGESASLDPNNQRAYGVRVGDSKLTADSAQTLAEAAALYVPGPLQTGPNVSITDDYVVLLEDGAGGRSFAVEASGQVTIYGDLQDDKGNTYIDYANEEIKGELVAPKTASLDSASTTAYTTNNEDEIRLGPSTAPQTVTLATADAFDGNKIAIRDAGHAAGTNAITVDTEGSEQFADGGTQKTIDADGGWLIVEWDNTFGVWLTTAHVHAETGTFGTTVTERASIAESAARLTTNSDQNVADSTPTVVEFQTSMDRLGGVDVANNRFTVQQEGEYHISGFVRWASDATNWTTGDACGVSIDVNGSSAFGRNAGQFKVGTGAQQVVVQPAVDNFASGDNIQLSVFQDSGAQQTLDHGTVDRDAVLNVVRVG